MRRLMISLAAGALVAALLPGVATAANDKEVWNFGQCVSNGLTGTPKDLADDLSHVGKGPTGDGYWEGPWAGMTVSDAGGKGVPQTENGPFEGLAACVPG